MANLYTLEAAENYLREQAAAGATVTQLNEGVLLAGDYLVERDGYKTAVLIETPLNEWSSGYRVKRFDYTSDRSRRALDNLVEKLSDKGQL